jgi:hypothetical protein
MAEFGGESWELDALEPSVLERLVRDAIVGIIDEDKMEAATAEQMRHRETLGLVADRFDDVEDFVRQ